MCSWRRESSYTTYTCLSQALTISGKATTWQETMKVLSDSEWIYKIWHVENTISEHCSLFLLVFSHYLSPPKLLNFFASRHMKKTPQETNAWRRSAWRHSWSKKFCFHMHARSTSAMHTHQLSMHPEEHLPSWHVSGLCQATIWGGGFWIASWQEKPVHPKEHVFTQRTMPSGQGANPDNNPQLWPYHLCWAGGEPRIINPQLWFLPNMAPRVPMQVGYAALILEGRTTCTHTTKLTTRQTHMHRHKHTHIHAHTHTCSLKQWSTLPLWLCSPTGCDWGPPCMCCLPYMFGRNGPSVAETPSIVKLCFASSDSWSHSSYAEPTFPDLHNRHKARRCANKRIVAWFCQKEVATPLAMHVMQRKVVKHMCSHRGLVLIAQKKVPSKITMWKRQAYYMKLGWGHGQRFMH